MKVKLGELGSFRNGLNFKKEQMGSGLKLINVKDIFGDGPFIDCKALDLVDLSNMNQIEQYTVEKNDIFLFDLLLNVTVLGLCVWLIIGRVILFIVVL